MAIPHPHTQPVLRPAVAGVAQAGAQLAEFWRLRVARALDAFEWEARRMLNLETQLGAFATAYEETVLPVLAHLTGLEEQTGERGTAMALPDAALVQHHSARCRARQDELKSRYRSMAMEVHPDRAQLVEGNGDPAAQMRQLTDAYRAGDLAALLKLEAQLHLMRMAGAEATDTRALDTALREIDRAAHTYAQGYRELLNSPLNALMLQALSAQREGQDWMEATVRRIQRSIEEKEQMLVALVTASGIGLLRETSAA